jgi:ABC-type multidrug transport system permease subunit
LYVLATTSMGLLISAFTRTQIAAILGTMIITSLPTIQFSGLIVPRSSLEGAAAVMGMLFPPGTSSISPSAPSPRPWTCASCGRNAWRCSGSLSGSPG